MTSRAIARRSVPVLLAAAALAVPPRAAAQTAAPTFTKDVAPIRTAAG
jgi:hypothetical protein